MTFNRRKFLHNCGALGVASGFAANLGSFNAFAADTSDYKALVCVFLFGAMDGHDTVIPYDLESHTQYSNIRGRLITDLDNSVEGFSPRRRDNLLELPGSSIGGRTFAFPEEFRPLHELYAQGDLAVVGNVGPLVEQVTRAGFESGGIRLPPRLFSHNDQQSIWQASRPEGALAGWGGRFADIVEAAGANSNSTFTSVSAAGPAVFIQGERINSFQISPAGAQTVDFLDQASHLNSSAFPAHYREVLQNIGGTTSNLFGGDYADVNRTAIEANEFLATQFALPGDPTTPMPNSSLGSQLKVISRIIARNANFGVKRQIFFAGIGGFDTHAGQPTVLPGLQAEVANSLRAFHDSMVELGLSNKVTTFTGSDFGRTLNRSGNGTDHGWGNHHYVMGGAVNGGRIIGDIPPPELGHDYDAGRGRLIPQIAVDQYAASLGQWFGLSNSELLDALPGLGNFDQNALGNLFT